MSVDKSEAVTASDDSFEGLTHKDASNARADDRDRGLVDREVSRRRAMQLGAVGIAGAAGIAGGSGSVAAASLNFGSDYVHDAYVDGSYTIESVDLEEMDVLEYTADDGTKSSLVDHGFVVASRDEDDEPHNPITLRADHIDYTEFNQLPRGETYTNADDDELDLNVLDATHWETDESGSSGTMTVETIEGANGADVLSVSSSSQGTDDVVTATFSDVDISSGEMRKVLQLIVSISTLESGSTVTVRITDDGGNDPEFLIDPDGDSAADDVIATETGDGIVYQQQLGDVFDAVDGINGIEIEIADANADMDFTAIALEKESRWSFGTEEYLNDDDEVDSQTVYEPSGDYSITTLNSMDFGTASIAEYDVDVEQRASELASEDVYIRDEESPSGYDKPIIAELAFRYEPVTAFDLSPTLDALRDETEVSSSRYDAVEFTRTSDVIEGWSDIDDLTLTDVTDQYGGSVGDEVEVTSTVSTDESLILVYSLAVDEDELSSMESAAGGAGGAAGDGDSGPFGLWTWIGGGALGLGALRFGLLDRLFGRGD